MQSRRRSLSLAKQVRTCPPPAIQRDPSQRKEYNRHLAICPYCSAAPDEERDVWGILGRHLNTLSRSKGKVTAEDMTPGQFRFIRHSLAGWSDAFFYNPPMVLVLENIRAISDDVLVSQIYHDISLAGPGDLILTGRHTPIGDLFVECWNSYTLKGSDLENSLGCVDPEIIQAVKSLGKDPTAYPPWAMIPRPLTDHGPRITFRELEVEVGYAFSSRSVSQLVGDLEGLSLRLVYDSTRQLQEAVLKTIPGTLWKKAPQSREEVLALADLPIEKLPLAAADRDEGKTSANLIQVKEGIVSAIHPIPLKIHGQSGRLTVSGRISDLPRNLKNSWLICFLDLEGRQPIAPIRCEWDESTGDFLIEFDHSEDAKWRLKAAVVFKPDNA